MKGLGILIRLMLYTIILGGATVFAVSLASFASPVPYFETFYDQESVIKIVMALAGLFFMTAAAFIVWVYGKIDKVLNKQKTIIDMLRLRI